MARCRTRKGFCKSLDSLQKAKAPRYRGAMSSVKWASAFIEIYPPMILRRKIPAIPTRPVPRRPKVPGSGTATLVVPTRM